MSHPSSSHVASHDPSALRKRQKEFLLEPYEDPSKVRVIQLAGPGQEEVNNVCGTRS